MNRADDLLTNTTTHCGNVNNFAPAVAVLPLQVETRPRSLWSWNVPESINRIGV